MQRIMRNIIHPTACLTVLALCSFGTLSAQRPIMKPAPLFGHHGLDSNPYADLSVTIASVPNAAYGTSLLAVYANNNALSYAVSLNATDIVYNTSVTGMPGMSCSAGTIATCTASIATFNGVIYIAYVDQATHGLDVVVATPNPGLPTYTLSLLHQDTTFAMTSSPTMTVYRGYLTIYFTGQTSTVPNGFFGVGFDGTNWLNLHQVAAF